MAEALLLVGHGSRDPEGNEHFLRFAGRVRAAMPDRPVQPCFIEFAAPPIPEAIDSLVAQGSREITVVPVILFAAGHAKVEVPEHLDDARRRYPGVRFQYGRPLGVHPLLVDILDEQLRVAEAAAAPRNRAETAVLLVGRGSSDPDANGDLFKMGRLLWEGRGFANVECCFMGITAPLLAEGLKRCVTLGARRVIVLPYFLYTGVLLKRMHRQMTEFAAHYPDVEFLFASDQGMGHHPNLLRLLQERRDEAERGRTSMNCDTCSYRLLADPHHHRHDHHGHHHHHD